ncbi:MAG: hypothetical protein BAJALOKI2v1_160026 [Promethearchaeota archaeon]|nr:MAG: hypothetical protein BAJALOKI2v1_160026 [Candidatus Lokiarchaeota archaeon]
MKKFHFPLEIQAEDIFKIFYKKELNNAEELIPINKYNKNMKKINSLKSNFIPNNTYHMWAHRLIYHL